MGLAHGRPLPGVTDDGFAVLGLNLSKTLDKGPMAFKIFDHLDIRVKRNSIYGLLGASGCGKTTLLKCLLGLLPVDHGEVWILGGQPNTPQSGVPGYQVGYMPQDISLLPEHTVRGAVRYFGGLAGKTKSQVDAKYLFFEQLIGLPRPGLRVKKLSGGDQRKVSLVCALIHEPELLILDEPTAGLEPKTREKIWAYLKQITRVEKRSTVIITTHYIEEAGGADQLGILRHAHMIAEDTPARLMRRHLSLEEAVILLSHEQDGTRGEVPVFLSPPEPPEEEEAGSVTGTPTRSTLRAESTPRPKNYLQLRFYNTCHKNMVRLIRNPTAALFSLMFPLIIIAALFLAIGGMPHSKFAVFNEDFENYDTVVRQGGLRSDNLPGNPPDPRLEETQRGGLRSNNLPGNSPDPRLEETQRGRSKQIRVSTLESISSKSRETGTIPGSDNATQESIEEVNSTNSPEDKKNDAPKTTEISEQAQWSEEMPTPNHNLKNTIKQEITSAGSIEKLMKSHQDTIPDGNTLRNLVRSTQADISSAVLSNGSGTANGSLAETSSGVLSNGSGTANGSLAETSSGVPSKGSGTANGSLAETSSRVLSNGSGTANGSLSPVTPVSGVVSDVLVGQLSQNKQSTQDVNAGSGADLNVSSHSIKRSTALAKRALVSGGRNSAKKIGYHENRISELVRKRGGSALPNLTCEDIAQSRHAGDRNRVLLSCVFLSTLQEMGHDDFQLDYFQDPEEVREAVERGEYRGYFLIYKNFTPSLERKFRGGVSSLLTPLSPVYVGLDMTDEPTGLRVQEELLEAQQRATQKYHRLLSPGTDGRYFSVPITLASSGLRQNDVHFVAPGVMIAMTFFLQSGLTSGSVILERNLGLWERHSVLGVTAAEIVGSHLLVNSALAFVQSSLVVTVVYWVYAVPCHGSLLIIFLLVYLQAITGELFGFLCSVFSRSITEVNFINLGLYYPVIHLCGVVWPLDAMTSYIRPVGYVFPLTLPIKAVRSVQARGGGDVPLGLLSSFVWITICLIAIFVTLRFRRVQ